MCINFNKPERTHEVKTKEISNHNYDGNIWILAFNAPKTEMIIYKTFNKNARSLVNIMFCLFKLIIII